MADIYAVRKTFSGQSSQKGLFSILDNAKKLAKRLFKYKVYDITTGQCVYTPPSYFSRTQAFIETLKYMNKVMKEDNKAGRQWVYSNGSIPTSKTFELAHTEHRYAVNCVSAVQWGMMLSGAVGTTRKAIQWYLSKGKIVWCSNTAKEDLKKYCKIIHINGKKTVAQAIKDKTLQAGDIIGYQTIAHTNVYLGNNKSFDSGHNFCKQKQGDGTPFIKWIGSTPYKNYAISYIIRFKEDATATNATTTTATTTTTTTSQSGWRVRVGIFTITSNAENLKQSVKSKTGFDCFNEVIGGQTYVYCGSYSSKANAEERSRLLNANGFSTAIVEV